MSIAGRIAERLGLGTGRLMRYRILVLVLTFLTYASYHMSRKAPSVVKGALHPHVESAKVKSNWNPVTNPGWAPFSDDLDPAKVAKDGYHIAGSEVCEINGGYKCANPKVDKDYYNQTYCQRYDHGKFSLRLISATDPLLAREKCVAYGGSLDGCWVVSGSNKTLSPKEREALCTHVQTEVNGTNVTVHSCILYIQPGGQLIPAPASDKNWLNIANKATNSTIEVETVITDGKVLLGSCDTVYLIFYAIGLFFSGHVADNTSLRVFLATGMIGSGLFVVLIGLAHVFEIHNLWYFYACYAIQGLFQSTGWPAVVAVMGNWFGKSTRGLVMGIWNAHTSVGNILGSTISGAALGMGMDGSDWPAAFYLSGGLITLMGIIVFFFLPNHPHDVGLPSLQEIEAEHSRESENALLNDFTYEDSLDGDSLETKTKKSGCSNFYKGLCIPGVIEFAFALFFAKFVAYMFIYWLPLYLGHLGFSNDQSAYYSSFFDVGGIIGGIIAGYVSDRIGRRAPVAFAYLCLSVPCLYFYRGLSASVGDSNTGLQILFMMVCGALVNGPYALITTAVSADLGSHPSLKGDLSLTATVTGIIDGTGSIGASIQGVLIGVVASGCNATGKSWTAVFYLLMVCCAFSAIMLSRLVWKEGPHPDSKWVRPYRGTLVLFVIGLLTVAVYCLVMIAGACGSGAPCTDYSA